MQNNETGLLSEITREQCSRPRKTAKELGFPVNSPTFYVGEVLSIKTGWWKVQKIWKGRMKLKSISLAEAGKLEEN